MPENDENGGSMSDFVLLYAGGRNPETREEQAKVRKA
jgi:hypothetical protein